MRKGSWGQGELFELLSLMMIGACLWIIGAWLGAFDSISRFAIDHGLLNLVMLCACMGLGVLVAAVRKSFLLRKAMEARIAAEAQAQPTPPHPAFPPLATPPP